MVQMRTVIKNAHVVNPSSEFDGDIVIEGRLIKDVGPTCEPSPSDTVIEVQGNMALPGFIDVHIQGGGGSDVLDGRPEAVNNVSRTCAKFGVTGFLATTVYRVGDDNGHLGNLVSCSRERLGGAKLLGIHIEGPFVSREKIGMISPSSVTDPSIELFDQILKECGGQLRMMTIAPELDGAWPIVERMLAAGVIPSFGHSSASYEQALYAFKGGVSHVTHAFNAMPSMHHRSPGPIPAILESPNVTAQIISDGVHIHPAMVRLLASSLGQERCVIITDGVSPLGLPDGEYEYDGRKMTVSEGVARYFNCTLIGTALGLSELGRRFLSFTGWDIKALAKVASWNPARVLGIEERKGSIEAGKDADIVILDPDLTVQTTLVEGRVAFAKSGLN